MCRAPSRTASPSRSMVRQGCTFMTKRSDVSSSISSAVARRVGRLALAAVLTVAGAARAQQGEPPELAQARQMFESLDYERALPLLDRALTMLQAQVARDPSVRQALTAAYGMPGRAAFGIATTNGATADFRWALWTHPGFS